MPAAATQCTRCGYPAVGVREALLAGTAQINPVSAGRAATIGALPPCCSGSGALNPANGGRGRTCSGADDERRLHRLRQCLPPCRSTDRRHTQQMHAVVVAL